MPAAVIHFVQYGLVACAMEMPPKRWPEGHFWASKLEDVTCPLCKQAATETPPTFELLDDGRVMRCLVCREVTGDADAVRLHCCPNCHIHHDDIWPPARKSLLANPVAYGIRPVGRVVRTVCRVVERNGKKYWVVIQNDTDPESVGETTACGLPRAESHPVWTLFESTFTIPNEQPSKS